MTRGLVLGSGGRAHAGERCALLLEPTDQPWGERVAYVSDPDGNRVMLTRE
jgi:uncharacterized glyoxalase superfamily protein PhnB